MSWQAGSGQHMAERCQSGLVWWTVGTERELTVETEEEWLILDEKKTGSLEKSACDDISEE